MKRLEGKTQPTEEIEKKALTLPKVFMDGHTLVKVALVNNFINCGNYKSRTGMTFEGCLKYSGELNDEKGIYYVPVAPVLSLYARGKISRSLDKMKEIIKQTIQNTVQYLKELLISYDNYGIYAYDKFVKGRMLKFPIQGEQGHLYVSRVPLQLNIPLEYEKVTQIEIYNHKIEFDREVVKFSNIHTFGGEAKLIYNSNDDAVMVTLSSSDHGEKTVMLKANQLYLFSHARPRQNVD